MNTKNLSISEYQERINKGEGVDPIILLDAIASGKDPRRLSEIYELVLEIDAFTGGEITKEDWLQIVDLVTSKYKYHPVSLSESHSAAKTLMEYMHPKQKTKETSGQSGNADQKEIELTEEQIQKVNDIFQEEF